MNSYCNSFVDPARCTTEHFCSFGALHLNPQKFDSECFAFSAQDDGGLMLGERWRRSADGIRFADEIHFVDEIASRMRKTLSRKRKM